MKKLSVVLYAIVLVFGVAGTVNAALTTIGTATYMGSDYNLIYEDDSIDGGLVWLDYTNSAGDWQPQVDWASGLGGSLTVNLDPGYTTDIDWGTGWRLPTTLDESYVYGWDGTTTGGYNVTTSEMGHLYYESLGNLGYFTTDGTSHPPGWGLLNTGDFNNLQSTYYYSGTEYTHDPWGNVWFYHLGYGSQDYASKSNDFSALAVRPGNVSGGSIPTVPIPSAIWLLGSGLIGLVGFRKKLRKEV